MTSETAAATQPASWERRTPTRDASLESDVAVPALQAAITGLLVGAATAGVAVVLHARHAAIIALVCGSVALLVAWLWLLFDHRDLLWQIETLTGQDFDRNGVIGKPSPPPAPDVWLTHLNRMERLSIPFADRAEATRIAVAVLMQQRQFSRRQLVDSGAIPEHPEHYTELFEAMLHAEFLEPQGNGGNLTGEGRRYLAQFLPTPLQRRLPV